MSTLVIGLGGVGTIAAYTLQKKTEVTAIVRSGHDEVKTNGFTIKSADYGEVQYKPSHVVKDLKGAEEFGPFDNIVVSTKVIPKEKNIWDDVKEYPKLFKKGTNVVLIQNGIEINKYWDLPDVNLISGVSYISSTKVGNTINQVAPDEVSFGLFDGGDEEALKKFAELYTNDINKANVRIDDNVRFTRLKKLLYNASYNTICCLMNVDVGIIYTSPDLIKKIKDVMKEIQTVANKDLEAHNSDKKITDTDIENMIKFTKEIDVPVNYEPSMLVDFRNDREIEVEVILGNLIRLNKDDKIPLLEFIYDGLQVIQYTLTNKLRHKS